MPTKLKSGQTLLFIGDSITDCDRRGNNAPLGWGYVKMFADLLVFREPEKRVQVINRGISGDVVTGLRSRWTDDVLWHRPDWLSIKIGINDLHRTLSHHEKDRIPPALYEEAYDHILARTRKALPRCQLLLIEPFYISRETDAASERRRVLDLLPKYHAVIRRLSARYRTRLLRTHDRFQRLLKHHPTTVFCGEPVHPIGCGHLMIAEAVYETLSR